MTYAERGGPKNRAGEFLGCTFSFLPGRGHKVTVGYGYKGNQKKTFFKM